MILRSEESTVRPRSSHTGCPFDAGVGAELELEFDKAQREAERLDKACRRAEASRRARVSFVPMADGATVRVNEPDLYTRGGRSFFSDLYLAQLKGDIEAKNRIDACLATGRDPFRPGRARSRETKRAPNA